jgi:hypothetical protein
LGWGDAPKPQNPNPQPGEKLFNSIKNINLGKF